MEWVHYRATAVIGSVRAQKLMLLFANVTWRREMIPKPLYESLPYLYMVIGIAVLVALGNYFAMFSGLMLFLAGSLIWILRSDHRRASRKQRGPIPYWLYELQPFLYASLGVSLGFYSQNVYFYPSAMILTVAGMQVWYLRSVQRRHRMPVNNRALI